MGFGHLGMIVEDVPKLVERAVAAGAPLHLYCLAYMGSSVCASTGSKLVKPQGVCTVETISWPPETPSPIEAFHKLYSNMAVITDPNVSLFCFLPMVVPVADTFAGLRESLWGHCSRPGC